MFISYPSSNATAHREISDVTFAALASEAGVDRRDLESALVRLSLRHRPRCALRVARRASLSPVTCEDNLKSRSRSGRLTFDMIAVASFLGGLSR
jgi:hypothetical protein